MNLQGLASSAIHVVRPSQLATLLVSTGSVTNADGVRVPSYQTVSGVTVDAQALTQRDLVQVSGLNLDGTSTAFYVRGKVDAVVRSQLKGGDKFVVNNQVWLVTAVLERWPDWTKVAVTLQDDTP